MAKKQKARPSALQCAEAESKAEIERVYEWFKANSPKVRPSFIERVCQLADASNPISQELLDEGVRRRVDANRIRRMFVVAETAKDFEKQDAVKFLLENWEYLNHMDDAACENQFGLPLDAIARWRTAHPGREPRPGEIWRWAEKRADDESARSEEILLKEQAREIALRKRNTNPPPRDETELREVFQMWRQADWRDERSWPTSAQVKLWTGLSQDEILKVAKKGRWGHRNVYRGGACRSKRGGRPPEQILPRGVANIVLRIAKSFPALSVEAEKLARFLSKRKT